MTLTPANIPAELKNRKAWICWRYEGNGSKPTKVPYIAALKNGELTYRASSRNPKHWNSFDKALKTLKNSDASGIGYVFSEDDPYAVADFDDALKDGVVDPKVKKWLEDLDTYTEVSVSGSGFHVICEAEVGAGASVAGYEVYDRARYIAMTGDVWQGREAVEERQEPFRKLSELVRERQRRLEGRKNLERRRDAQRPFDGEGIDVEDFLYDNRVSILRQVGDSGGRKFQILCPWLNQHTGGDESGSYAGQFDDGALWFDCKHSHCRHLKWQEFKEATQTEDGLAEWAKRFRKDVRITVGKASSSNAQVAPAEVAEETPDEQPEEEPVPIDAGDLVDEFIREGRFPVHDAIVNGVDPPEELLEDILLAGKAHTIFAPGGAGKTWVIVWLATQLVQLGKTVVMFDLENSGRTISERFESVGIDPGRAAGKLYLFDFPSLHPEIYEGVLDRLKPDIVMFDSWVGFISGGGFDENAATDIAAWANTYIRPAKKRNIATLMLDHVPHEDDDRERGSTRKRDEVDVRWKLSKIGEFDRESTASVLMWLKKDREGWLPGKLSFEIGGDLDTGQFVMRRDDELARLQIVSYSPSEKAALRVLEARPEGYKAAEWQKACEPEGVTKRDFYRAKSRLEEKKKVAKIEGVFVPTKPYTSTQGATGADLVQDDSAPTIETGGSGVGATGAPPKGGVHLACTNPTPGMAPDVGGFGATREEREEKYREQQQKRRTAGEEVQRKARERREERGD